MEKTQIIFLGSGGGRKITASQARATGGFVIQVGKEQIHIDPGVGSVVRAVQFGIDTRNATIILVSHFHIDHSNDVNALIDAITFGGKEKKGILITSGFGEKENLSNFHKNAVKDHVVLKPKEKSEIGNVIVKATETKGHGDYTIGYKVFTPNFVLGYTSDTSFFPRLIDEFNGCDILVVNTIKPKGQKLEGHMNSDDAAKLIKGVKPKLAILQHFGRSMLEANPVYEARNVQKQSGVQIIAAQDGLVVDASSYSVSLKQKTINLY